MKLYVTDDLFFFEEQVIVWRREYPGGVLIIDGFDTEKASPRNFFGPILNVFRIDKFPSAKKADETAELFKSFMDEEDYVVFFTKATRADLKSPLVKLFPSDNVVKMFSYTMEQREEYLAKQLPNIPLMKRVAIAERSEGMDMRSFRSRVMRLKELRATDDASIDREFPPLFKGESFSLAPLAEKGTDEGLAKALLSVENLISHGDDPMIILGTLHWIYRVSYKMALAPNRKGSVSEIGISLSQADRIPVLTPERALIRHDAVAEAGEEIRKGRNGFEAISALLCRISDLAKSEKGAGR